MAKIRVEDIPTKRRSDILLADEVNALVDSAKPGNKIGEYTSSMFPTKRLSTSRWPIQAYSTGAIPAYSIFGLVDTEVSGKDPVRIQVGKIGISGPATLAGGYFTNGEAKIEAGGYGLVRPIQFSDVCILKGEIPVGSWCGPHWQGTGSFELNAEGWGFFSLGPAQITGHTVVIRTVEPISVLVEITEDIPGRRGTLLGSGNASVYFRKTADRIEGASLGVVPVYNTCEEAVLSDPPKYVLATCCLGVGLVLTACAGSGNSGSELPSSSSLSSSQSSSQSGGSQSNTCLSIIEGVDVNTLPIATPSEVSYLLAINSDGCLVRVPISPCDTSSSSV
jgi:hypothetical protein